MKFGNKISSTTSMKTKQRIDVKPESFNLVSYRTIAQGMSNAVTVKIPVGPQLVHDLRTKFCGLKFEDLHAIGINLIIGAALRMKVNNSTPLICNVRLVVPKVGESGLEESVTSSHQQVPPTEPTPCAGAEANLDKEHTIEFLDLLQAAAIARLSILHTYQILQYQPAHD